MGKVKNDEQTFSSFIGAIVIDFEKSIFAFSVIINCLTNSKDGDKIYKMKCSSKDKISEFRVIIKKIAPDTLKQEGLKLLAELGKIRELRNHLVHSIGMNCLIKKQPLTNNLSKKVNPET